MAQADQSVQNATFPTVRADINSNLAALFTDSSGNTAPSVTVAFQDWIDTSGTNPLWKKRNAANNAWITLGTISSNAIAFEGTLPSQSGNSGKYLSTDGTVASWESALSLGTVITAGTAVATTSGTAIDFTGIPSWVKRITVMFSGVSTNGTSPLLVQLGAGSVTTSGYSAKASSTANLGLNSTSGFVLVERCVAETTYNGHEVVSNVSGNIWVSSNLFMPGSDNAGQFGSGTVTLSGTLDRLRLTTVNGTNTFDAGTINILYEG